MTLINKIKALFGRAKEPAFNMYHPDLASKITFAFECGGKKYYRFGDAESSNEIAMPTGRYKFYLAFLQEVELRMSLPTLQKYLAELRKALEGGQGQVKLGRAWELIISMEGRTKLAFEPATVRRLASVTFFDENEDLSDYDRAYCEKKLAHWDKYDGLGFFLRTPIKELCGLNGISLTDLTEYMNQMDAIIKDLTPDPPTPSSTSS